ncbi:hypothetical protein V8B97DRAFT_2111848, partial [Scleroderma yunnanense]
MPRTRPQPQGQLPTIPGQMDCIFITNRRGKTECILRDDGFVRRPEKSIQGYLCNKNCRVDIVCEALGIDATELKSITALVKELIPKYLDLNKTFKSQDKRKLKSFKKEIQQSSPHLNRFEDGWGAEVLIRRTFARRHNFFTEFWLDTPQRSVTAYSQEIISQSTPASLSTFLNSIEPNASYLLFIFAHNGLYDDEKFADFIKWPVKTRKAFVLTALQGHESDAVIQGVLTA